MFSELFSGGDGGGVLNCNWETHNCPWLNRKCLRASLRDLEVHAVRLPSALICYNPFAMTTMDAVLVPSNTVASSKGDGPGVDVSVAANRVFLVTLTITKIIEQESLDLSIYGSADGTTWGAKSLAAFPQEFYRGEWPLLLDLTAYPDVKFVRAHWEMARWGRGTETPMFEFGVSLKEVPAEMLREIATA